MLSACTSTSVIEEKDAQINEKQTQIDEKQSQIDKQNELLVRERSLSAQLANDIKLKNVEIQKLEESLSVTLLDKVLFRSGSTVIMKEGKDILTRVAASLKNSNEGIRVEGHTDNVAIGSILIKSIPTNWELSALRATSVVRFLEAQGIASERMQATGHSKFKPVTENTTADNKQLNRRVEILLIPNASR
jgi:chemotaxis protein MotB